MPRDGSGVWSPPPGSTATANTTILSSVWNAFVSDITADANAARPITAGGTGGDTAVAGHDGLVTMGADVESDATLNLNTATGAFLDITGTTTVTAVTLDEGKLRMARAVAAFQLTASASLVVNGSTTENYTTTAGDLLIFEGYASSVVRVWSVGAGVAAASNLEVLAGIVSNKYISPATAYFPPGHLYGNTLANDTTDATNDLVIGAGTCRDSSDTQNIRASSSLIKRLDANWASGTNQGMRYSGAAIANGTYHIYRVAKAQGADPDVYADPSATEATVLGHLQAETGGADYLYVRRIGSIIRSGGAILGFVQNGDEFLLKTWITDITATSMGTSAVTRTLTVPSGVKVDALLHVGTGGASGADARGVLYSPDESDPTLSTNFNIGSTGVSSTGTPQHWSSVRVRTNTSSQVVSKFYASAATTQLWITTRGWVDTRGRL